MKKVLLIALLAAASLGVAVPVVASASSASRTGVSASDEVAAKVRVPNVVGFRMDKSTRALHNLRLRVNEECSGLFGCIVKSRWWICDQSPRAGKYVNRYSVVVTYGERRGEC
jgi:hypothetical protein